MRLGQLARKLSIRRDQIVEYLQKFNISLDEGSNARIEDIHAEKAIAHFAPTLTPLQIQELLGKEIIQESEPEVVVEEIKLPEVSIEESIVNEPEEIIAEVVEVDVPTPETEEEKSETTEVIKAPKVELPGLRVIGKIELPQPKKKEEELPTDSVEAEGQNNVTTENIPEERKPSSYKTRNNRSSRNRDDNRERPRKNPIAMQREREARHAEKKKREEDEKKKEQRAVHYAKKIKPQSAVKSVTQYRDEVVEVQKQVVKVEPTTTWGRFLKWFWRQ